MYPKFDHFSKKKLFFAFSDRSYCNLSFKFKATSTLSRIDWKTRLLPRRKRINRDYSMENARVRFLCGISHTKSEAAIFFYLFLYLFICPLIEVLVTWFLVWVCRREKTGFQYTVCRLCFVGGHCFFRSAVVYLV